jgi:hypothetical protein
MTVFVAPFYVSVDIMVYNSFAHLLVHSVFLDDVNIPV